MTDERIMKSTAADPFLRYAATGLLQAAPSRRSLSAWPFLVSSDAARLVAGLNARMICNDYANGVGSRRASRRSRQDDKPTVVTDDWLEQVPIGDAELRAIEGHMRQELDELFGPLP